MTITPFVAVVGALGGYLVYNGVKDAKGNASQPNVGNPMPWQSSFWHQGAQPQTGNGAPNVGFDQTGKDVANVVGGLAKFGTSLVEYFGTSRDEGNDYGGGVGANSTQTSSFGVGGGDDSGGSTFY